MKSEGGVRRKGLGVKSLKIKVECLGCKVKRSSFIVQSNLLQQVPGGMAEWFKASRLKRDSL